VPVHTSNLILRAIHEISDSVLTKRKQLRRHWLNRDRVSRVARKKYFTIHKTFDMFIHYFGIISCCVRVRITG
jgi:hypothetical protein